MVTLKDLRDELDTERSKLTYVKDMLSARIHEYGAKAGMTQDECNDLIGRTGEALDDIWFLKLDRLEADIWEIEYSARIRLQTADKRDYERRTL